MNVAPQIVGTTPCRLAGLTGPSSPAHRHGQRSNAFRAAHRQFNEAAAKWRQAAFGSAGDPRTTPRGSALIAVPTFAVTLAHRPGEKSPALPHWRRALDNRSTTQIAMRHVQTVEALESLIEAGDRLRGAAVVVAGILQRRLEGARLADARGLRDVASGIGPLTDLLVQLAFVHSVERLCAARLDWRENFEPMIGLCDWLDFDIGPDGLTDYERRERDTRERWRAKWRPIITEIADDTSLKPVPAVSGAKG